MFDEQIKMIESQIEELEIQLELQLDDVKFKKAEIANKRKAIMQLEKLGENL